MDLCLMIEGQEGVSWPEWHALAVGCEQHGIPALLRSDHYLNLSGGHPERGALDAWGTLCALAAVTSRLRLGTLVSPATFRHPSELAKLATTADHVSEGRIEVGLGAGWHEREHAAYGFPFPDMGTRMDLLEEQLQVLLGNWSETPASFTGEHYRLDDLDARPKPFQTPHPPLIMGGNAGPRSARLAARYADEYNTVFADLDTVRERRGRIIEACERAGRDPIPFSLMTAVIAGADARDLRARVERVACRIGTDADSLIREPPPGWVVGEIEPVAGRLRELAQAGVARVMCQHLDHEDLEFIALLGDEIAPLVEN